MGAFKSPLRWRRSTSLGTVSLLIGAVLVWAAAPSFAVHDNGMFELDGNTVHNSASTPPYDWNSLFDASGNRLVTPDPDNGPLLASTFVKDAAEPDQSYFTSNKDIQPIAHTVQHWGCDPINNPLDKDNLLNAYAALVQVPANAPDNAGDQVLYLGSERGSNNGTSFAGFWLLKDKSVGCTGTAAFSGQHTDGDLLIVSDYTNGGGTQDVTVYRWTGDDASGAPVLQASFNGSICSGSLSNDNACAIANASTITTPWSPTSHASNTFVETGIDLTDLLGQNGGCFTNFMAETRSSAELTATLKDFAGGSFNTCVPPPIVTTATPGGSLNPPGVSNQHDVASISAVGNRPAPTGSISFFLCNPSQVTAGGCVSGGTAVGGAVSIVAGSATSANASGSLTQDPGKYCWRAEYTPDTDGSNFYVPSSETNATVGGAGDECFIVVHGSPTITTQATTTAINGGPVPGLGFTALGDGAQLSNFVGTVTGNQVNFALYDVTADPGCTGAPVFTTTGTLDASGHATTSSTYTPLAAHTYTWIASYLATTPPNNDLLNDDAVGSCTDANESVTIVGAHIDVSKSANPPGPVSAGQNIGFDITVSNQGSIPATGVTVHDALPAKATGNATGDLNWTLTPYTNCSISGAVGSQVLDCNLGTVNPSTALPPIHLTSPTTPLDCGVVTNVASVSTTNGTGEDSDPASVTVQCPSLSFTKTADHDSVSAGSQIGFTVTASNAGPGSALGVVINDPLPAGTGIDWSIASQTASACTIQGSPPSEVLHCDIGTLGSGSSYSVHIVSGTTGGSCGNYVNLATLTATNAAQLTASDDTTVQCPDLHITKNADADAVNAGTDIGFVIVASNTGQGVATGALINDPLPTGPGISWSILSATGPLTCVINSNTLTCTGTLGAGQSETVHITSHTSFASCGEYTNTATLTATNSPQAPNASDSTSVLCANIVIHKQADAEVVNVGSDIGFTVTITNNGDGAANAVDVEDPLPAGQGIDWSIASQSGPLTCVIDGTPPSETLKCTGDLAASGAVGDEQSVHITSHTQFTEDGGVTTNSCGVYNNTATVTWGNGPADPISSNEASERVNCPALTLVKEADAATVNAGEQIGFTVTATNSNAPNTGTALEVVIDDPLPSGDGISWSIKSGPSNCSITGTAPTQTLHCDSVTLLSGESESVHIVSDTAFASCQAYPNTASLTALNHPALTAEDTTTVLCPAPDLAKTADAASVSAGQQIGFTVTASNSGVPGTGTAVGVVINDPLPGGAGVDWSIESGPDNCSITGTAPNQTLECTAVDLAAGASESVHIVSDTEFASCGTYDNTATLTLTNGEGPLTANATTAVECPSLGLTKTADDASVQAGNQIGFTITVTNEGPGTATAAALSDPLPAGDDVDWSIDAAETTAIGCDVSGSEGNQVLSCLLGDLAANASVAVHLVSATTSSSCATYPNVATLDATNAPELTARASTSVTGCLGTAPEPPIAITGVQGLGWQLGWGLAFLVIGGFTLLMARRRVPPHTH